MHAKFQDRGSLVTTRNPTRLQVFVLSQPRGYAVLWGGGVAKHADATQSTMSSEHQLLRAITWLLMTVPGCAPLTVFCWNAIVQNILTSSMQDRLLQPNELMVSKAPREAWGGVHAQMQGRAVDVFLWSLPLTAEKVVQDMLRGAMADALQRQQVQMVMDSAVEIPSTADTAAPSDFSLGSEPVAMGSDARMGSESS